MIKTILLIPLLLTPIASEGSQICTEVAVELAYATQQGTITNKEAVEILSSCHELEH